jgi:hypothetical protein
MSETSISLTCFAEHEEEQKYYWTVAMPQKGFRFEALLHSIYAVSAFHWSKLEPENKEASAACKTYFGLAISGHRDDVCYFSVIYLLMRKFSCVNIMLTLTFEGCNS